MNNFKKEASGKAAQTFRIQIYDKKTVRV